MVHIAWTTPKTWATNDSLGASVLNTHIRDNENFLYSPPMCRVSNSSALSIPNNSDTSLTFDTEVFDAFGMHSTSSNTNRITIPSGAGGKFLITAHVEWASNATGVRVIKIRHNDGATVASTADTPATTGVWTQSIATFWALAAGDWVDVLAYQNSGGSLNVNAATNYSPHFAAAWQGN